jgi:formate hydrogenlyase subunit 4
MRLTVLLALLSNLFVPWGIAGDSLAMLPVGVAAIAAKVAVAGAALAAAEVFMAKLRMFRVPELLAGSFVLALFAVASSFFLVAP